MIQEFNDNTPMPFGKHKGQAMVNVPAEYLLWVWENTTPRGGLKQYLESNLDVIKRQVEFKKKQKKR